MSEDIRLRIERDNLGRILNRITEDNGAYWTVSYSYNISGDISEVLFMDNNVVSSKQEYQYEYDQHGNKTLKVVEMIDFIRETKTKSILIYNNYYYENRITKKVCLYDGIRIYENVYYYEEDKIVRIERFNGRDSFALWRVELFNYLEGLIENAVYLANNVLSHYVIYRVLENRVISKQIMNPSKGRYYWSLSSFNEDYCSVYVGESIFSCDALSEIMNYVLSIKKISIECFLVVIECSDTMLDTSDKRIRDVVQDYSKQGISVQYSP